MEKNIHVLLVDDHPIMRQGLRRLLEDLECYEVTEAENGQEAYDKALAEQPDVVLMDIDMPVMNGLEACRKIKEENPNINIVMLSMHSEEEYLFEAIKAGAIGYLSKDKAGEELIGVIDSAAQGLSKLDPLLAAKVLAEFSKIEKRQEKEESLYKDLTAREKEILKYIAEGQSNKEIAKELFISDKTVKNHLKNIFAKLHINDRTKAAVIAIKEGLIDPS